MYAIDNRIIYIKLGMKLNNRTGNNMNPTHIEVLIIME